MPLEDPGLVAVEPEAALAEEIAGRTIIPQRGQPKPGQAALPRPVLRLTHEPTSKALIPAAAIDLEPPYFRSAPPIELANDIARHAAANAQDRDHPVARKPGRFMGRIERIGVTLPRRPRQLEAEIAIGEPHRIERFDALDLDKGIHPSAAIFSSASRSSWARLFFSAAVLSWPQAASMSRPRGVRTGAEMPASKMMFEKARTRSGVEVS